MLLTVELAVRFSLRTQCKRCLTGAYNFNSTFKYLSISLNLFLIISNACIFHIPQY